MVEHEEWLRAEVWRFEGDGGERGKYGKPLGSVSMLPKMFS